MIRLSNLRNCPVVCQSRQIGFIQNAALDKEQMRVQAFVVARGLRGKCILPVQAVDMISDEFILVSRTQKYDRQIESSGTMFVRDTDGLLIGRVCDYAIDERTFKIEAIWVQRGYLPPELHTRIWLFSCATANPSGMELIVPRFRFVESAQPLRRRK